MALKVDIAPKDFIGMQLTHDIKKGKKKLMIGSQLSVQDIVGDIEKGMRRFGFTAGQFSLSDLIDYILFKTGPADVYLSTWAASQEGLKKTFMFIENKMIKNIKFMIDAGAKNFRDKQFGELLDRFGDCLRTTKIHAKFVVIRNDKFDIVIRTSANLNNNSRLENFEIDEDKEFAEFFQKFFDEAFKQIAVNDNHKLKSQQKLKPILDAVSEQMSMFDSDGDFDMDVDFG